MERKKKRDKSLANGGEVDCAAGQHGDVNLWQREPEQQGSAKKLAVAGDSPTQPFLPSVNWSYTQQQSVQQASQQSAHASVSQSHSQAQQQPTSQQGLQGAPQQPVLPGQQPLSGWQNPEFSGQSTGAGHYPFHPGSSDSNWQPSNYPGGGQSVSGTAAPYNYPGGFGFPPPPYPGLWDPVLWWAHNAQQQPVYPYPLPGYGSGYAYPIPPTPPVGTNHRGLIKAPPGLSQKHQRLWEAQSMENAQLWAANMQLWASVARVEAEIACQRGKIHKLEGDMQLMKAHQEALMEASAMAAPPQPARRGRRKKAAPAPSAIAGVPAAQPTRMRAQGRKTATSRVNLSKIDLAKVTKETESEEKEKETTLNHIPGLVDRSIHDQDQKIISLTVGPSSSETGAERNLYRHNVECQPSGSENHRLTGEKDNSDYRHTNQNSPFRHSLPQGIAKDSNCEQNMEMKEAPIVTFLNGAVNVDKQGAVLGDSGFKVESTGISRREDWSGADATATARNAILRARFQAHYSPNGMERSPAVNAGKSISRWHYTGEDGSDEQDEVVASGQDDDEADDDDETTLDEVNGEKVGNYMVLDSATAMSKEMSALSRW